MSTFTEQKVKQMSVQVSNSQVAKCPILIHQPSTGLQITPMYKTWKQLPETSTAGDHFHIGALI